MWYPIRYLGQAPKVALAVCLMLALFGANWTTPVTAAQGTTQTLFHESFDESADRLPPAWSGAGTIVSDAHEGVGSLLVVDDSTESYAGVRSPAIQATAGTSYTVSVWTKTDDPVGEGGFISILIEEFDRADRRVAVHWLDSERALDWTLNEYPFTTTPQTHALHLTAYANARGGVGLRGKVWYDELTLVASPDERGETMSPAATEGDNADTEAPAGVKWQMPAYLEPDLTLEHPRVFTRDFDFDVPILTGRTRWLDVPDEEIRALVPEPGSYYIYGLGGICPTDGSKLEPVGWHAPGKVRCASGDTFPSEEYPDDGSGWTAPDGTIYYFVARWNSFVVSEMTAALEPLAYAYVITGDKAYAHKAAVILDALATVYPTATEGPLDYPGLGPGKEGGRLDRPYYQVTRSLRTYVNAFDLIWNSGVLDVASPSNSDLTIKENVAYNLILNGADYAYRTVNQPGYRDRLHNGTADFNHGILAAGSLLGIDEYIDWVVNGPTSIGNMIVNNIDRDGNYFETSPSYADHTRRLYLDIAEALYHLRTPRYPEGINLYDDPRFARFYIGIKEKNSIAGRVALYGDAGPDRAIVRTERRFDQEAFQWALLFYARTDSPEKRAEYAQYLADMADGNPNGRLTNGRVHLFRVERVTEYDAQATEAPSRPSELFGAKGVAMLRSGDGLNQRGALLRYGATLNHGQFDELGINFYAAGRELSNDPGHSSAHYRSGWTRRTVSHNTVVVDEKSQLTADSSGGSLNYFSAGEGYSIVDASNELAYDETDLYRRTLALIDTSSENSYLVDIFRVNGGQSRDYSFHGLGRDLQTSGLNLSAPEPGSLADPNYCWGEEIRSDGFLRSFADQGYYWSPPPGNSGYGFLCGARHASTHDVWQATWADRPGNELGVRLTMLPEADREVIIASGPSPMQFVPYVLARDTGPQPSQFVALIDLGTGQFQVDRVQPLELVTESDERLRPVAFAATLAEHRGAPAEDVILSTLSGKAFTAMHNGTRFQTDAEFALIRSEGEAFPTIRMEKGSLLVTPTIEIEANASEYGGRIVAVDDHAPAIVVESRLPLGDSLQGRHILIDADEYSHNSPYVIERVEQAGDYYRVYVSTTDFLLAQGLLETEPREMVLPSVVDLPYSRNVLGALNRYFDGKRVTNEEGASTVIRRVDANFSHLHVENSTSFASGEKLLIHDVKPGDRFSVPGFVHLEAGANGIYELTAPEAVWIHLPADPDTALYHQDTDGSFVQAVSEVRDGARWHLIEPGRVLLARTGTWARLESDPAAIAVRLVEAGSGAPLLGAVVRTQIEGRTVAFVEGEAGRYTATIPAETQVGVRTLTISAEKAGVNIPPFTTEVTVTTPWEIVAPTRVEVERGQPVELSASLRWENDGVEKADGGGSDRGGSNVEEARPERTGVESADGNRSLVEMILVAGDHRIRMNQEEDGTYRGTLPPVYRDEHVKLVAGRPGGFVRTHEIDVAPTGGRILPIRHEMRVTAREAFAIEVTFTDSHGEPIPEEYLPEDAVVFVGLGFNKFSRVEGTNKVAATMRGLPQGTHRIDVTAKGYESAEIVVIAENP